MGQLQETELNEMPQGLIYGLEDRPPLRDALFAALQHLLAIFVAIITPPLIIAGALNLDLQTTGFLVSMALFVSGIATFIQCHRFGPVGCGLLCVQAGHKLFIHWACHCRRNGWRPSRYFWCHDCRFCCGDVSE